MIKYIISMSFIIKGGFDTFRNQIVNVILKKTNMWGFGTVSYNKQHLCNISASQDNKIELIKYNNTKHALVLNNMIIYENERLFIYDIDLQILVRENDYREANIYNSFVYEMVDYKDMRQYSPRRTDN